MSVTHLATDDPTLASRYLANQLPEDERTAFEERLLTDPQALRELEATARFKLGLAKLRRNGRLADLVQEQPPAGRWLYGVAAAVAALMIGIGVLRWTGDAKPMLTAELSALVDSSGNPLHLVNTYAVFHARGSVRTTIIELPASRQAIQLRVLPDVATPQATAYRASLQRLADDGHVEPAATLEGLRPAGDGYITIFIDSQRMTPGDYQLSVSNDADMAATTFGIRAILAR
ncbi:MAG TPA: hypothetical protein VNQ81_03410 [Povalibacter sp.]|nr:hypothetical protein [Povalibacter sp.]